MGGLDGKRQVIYLDSFGKHNIVNIDNSLSFTHCLSSDDNSSHWAFHLLPNTKVYHHHQDVDNF